MHYEHQRVACVLARVWTSACDTVPLNKRDLYRGKKGLLPLLRIDSVTEMILMLCASLCACARTSVSFCVLAPRCFADQMHLLFNSPSQQAALTKCTHAPARARPHNLRCKHAGREMNMEMKTRQVCKYLVWGAGDGLGGRGRGWRRGAGGCRVRGKSQKIGPMFVCACECCACADSPDGAQDARKWASALLVFLYSCV